MARRLAREEAIFAGTSTGANIVAALRVAERLGTGATVSPSLWISACVISARRSSVSDSARSFAITIVSDAMAEAIPDEIGYEDINFGGRLFLSQSRADAFPISSSLWTCAPCASGSRVKSRRISMS